MHIRNDSKLDLFSKFQLSDNQKTQVKGGNGSSDGTDYIIIVDDIF